VPVRVELGALLMHAAIAFDDEAGLGAHASEFGSTWTYHGLASPWLAAPGARCSVSLLAEAAH
jgi:hypothetical protein